MSETGQAQVTVRADPALVWALVTDVTRIGEWSPEARNAEWLDGHSAPPSAAGSKGHNRRGRTKWSTTCEVIESEPARVFRIAVGRPSKPDTMWRSARTAPPHPQPAALGPRHRCHPAVVSDLHR